MAGDWIKMRMDLGDDPAVVLIADRTGLDEDAVVGKLHRLWCWADKHTTDGTAPAISPRWVDRYVSQAGFSDAMVASGWLHFTETGVEFPNFERHNGKSAKTRAENTIRQRLSRKSRDDHESGEERTPIPRPFVRHVMERDGYTCVYCGTESDAAKEKTRHRILSVDHIIPESRGGSAAIENLACCCRKCNNEKNDRTPEEWGIFPEFLQEGVTYCDGKLSQTKGDNKETREEKSRDKPPTSPIGDVPPPAGSQKKKTEEITFNAWLERIKSAGEKAVSDYQPVFDYADKVGIPVEWIEMAWLKFRERYGTDPKASKKRYADWRRVFLNAVSDNWLGLWWLRDGQAGLTTAGEQAKLAQRPAA